MPATFSAALPQCGVEDARLTQLLNGLYYAATPQTSSLHSTGLLKDSAPGHLHQLSLCRLQHNVLLPATRTRAIRRPARHLSSSSIAAAPSSHSNVPVQLVFDPGGVS